MLSFVPSDDLSSSPGEASAITSLDFGYVKAGETKSEVIRVSNPGASVASIELIPESPLAVEPRLIVLPPDTISDTVVLTVSMPLDAVSRSHTADLLLSSGEKLVIEWETVGANTERQAQYPARTGNPTHISTSVIESKGDTLRLYRFDPIPFDESTATLRPGRRFKIEKTGKFAGEFETIRSNVCDLESRLDGANPTCGYTMVPETIVAQFTSENIEITTTNLTSNKAPLTYSISATLIIPAEFELLREWAPFQPESETDKAQYKRTVYVVKRQGVLHSIENIRTLDFGDNLSHYSADLVGIHCRDNGNPYYFNPWAITYEYESDKPYATFPLENALIEEFIADASGSGANSSNDLNPSAAPPAPVETAPIPVSATKSWDNLSITVTFDKPLQAGALDHTNWHWYSGAGRFSATSANSIGNTVVATTTNVPGADPHPAGCDYSPPPADVIGDNGLAVDGFTDFPFS